MRSSSTARPARIPPDLAATAEAIIKYFSEDLNADQSLLASMRRKQLRRSLLRWAEQNAPRPA